MISSIWSNAPLTMNRMCLVLIVSRLTLPFRWNSNAACSCAWMSVGERNGTSVSSISLSRLVCTPRPLTSRPMIGGVAILSIFVEVDDAVLRELHVAVGAVNEFAHEVFDVAADVAGFAELGGVGLHERHADQVGDAS